MKRFIYCRSCFKRLSFKNFIDRDKKIKKKKWKKMNNGWYCQKCQKRQTFTEKWL